MPRAGNVNCGIEGGPEVPRRFESQRVATPTAIARLTRHSARDRGRRHATLPALPRPAPLPHDEYVQLARAVDALDALELDVATSRDGPETNVSGRPAAAAAPSAAIASGTLDDLVRADDYADVLVGHQRERAAARSRRRRRARSCRSRRRRARSRSARRRSRRARAARVRAVVHDARRRASVRRPPGHGEPAWVHARRRPLRGRPRPRRRSTRRTVARYSAARSQKRATMSPPAGAPPRLVRRAAPRAPRPPGRAPRPIRPSISSRALMPLARHHCGTSARAPRGRSRIVGPRPAAGPSGSRASGPRAEPRQPLRALVARGATRTPAPAPSIARRSRVEPPALLAHDARRAGARARVGMSIFTGHTS